MTQTHLWLQLSVAGPDPALEALVTLLVDWGAGGTVREAGRVAAWFPPARRGELEAQLARFAAAAPGPLRWDWEAQDEADWLDRWKEFFRPARLTPHLAVCPSWEEWAPPDPLTRVIRLDPGRAFGTGTHETTRLCLQLLDAAVTRTPAAAFLDVGCGSGILALAARLLGIPRVVALDVDPLAAACARENAEKNGVSEGFGVICGDLRAVCGQFPLVAANILYQILLGLAPTLAGRVSPGGHLILSGMLVPELPSAERVYGRVGFQVADRAEQGEWGALLLQRCPGGPEASGHGRAERS